MAAMVSDDGVEPVARLLLGAVQADEGPTVEQWAVLDAIVSGLWHEHRLDLRSLDPIGPDDAATAVASSADRRRARELIVVLELCRHPLSTGQTERAARYAEALGGTDVGIAIARDLVVDGIEQATADFRRFQAEEQDEGDEISLRGTRYAHDLGAPDPELTARLLAFHDLPPGTLGREYVEFYRRNGLALPGQDVRMPAVYVSHDMCHVIAGYEPDGPGEIALGAMQLAVQDSDLHWMQFLGNLAVHEAGYVTTTVADKGPALERPGAAGYVAQALRRGERCHGDFTRADHLALVERPLTEVRDRLGVAPLAP